MNSQVGTTQMTNLTSDLVDQENLFRPKTKRHKGMKYFNKVGYTQNKMKEIPRWCADMELLDKMVVFQKKIMSADKIYGKMDPRRTQFNLREIFPAARLVLGSRKQKRYDNRGSSAVWNDEHEFATPINVKQNENELGGAQVNSSFNAENL